MNLSDELARLERVARLREPTSRLRGPSRGVMVFFLLVLLPLAGLWAHGATTAENWELALNRWGESLLSLTLSAQVSDSLLYDKGRMPGRLLRVLARLVFLPAALVLFVASLYPAFGLHGVLFGLFFVLCGAALVWVVVRFSSPVREQRRG